MSLTTAQQRAVAARGNVLVSAAAGTGKTSTLTERCLACLAETARDGARVSVEELLVVTFTEAAAAEMRQRLRNKLEAAAAQNPDDPHWPEQLALFDAAHIGTLHGFCLKLVRRHFHALGLDPQFRVLDEGEARLLADESLDALLREHYAGKSDDAENVRKLIQSYGGGNDRDIRALVLKLHEHTQTRPDPAGWFARQLAIFTETEPVQWREWLLAGLAGWRDDWLPELESLALENEKAAECAEILRGLTAGFSREQASEILNQLDDESEIWPKGRIGELRPPLKPFFADVAFLLSVSATPDGKDPLREDWEWTRGPMTTLLRLARDFTARFSAEKLEAGAVDFHDLEQSALQLLWNFERDEPTELARQWRGRLRYVFVDEYQDINAAQDKIIAALSRDQTEANRFLVGDVKQSIYRFRQANPDIFRGYARDWRGGAGQMFALTENFRSREEILAFANSVFGFALREELGGVKYDDAAQLRFGEAAGREPLKLSPGAPPRVELLLRVKGISDEENRASEEGGGYSASVAELQEAEKEARMIALKLRELHEAKHPVWHRKPATQRPVEWRDMAVLMRAPAAKAEGYAREFARAGVPLLVERGGFFDCMEVTDLLSLLTVLDNPLQDLPLLAVLRSPLGGFSLDELATIRLAAKEKFWTALARSLESKGGLQTPEIAGKVRLFLERLARWRSLARQVSLSSCLETILSESRYADWLRGQPRGEQRYANIQRLLALAQQFDEFQRQGLFRFLRFIEAQQEVEAEPEVASVAGADAVRLMSIHQSKGLEFPVVALADLDKGFNQQDLRGTIILEDHFGLGPQIQSPGGGRYPSLPHWLARQRERRELAGEEMRLLYVALTRACDTLLLSANVSKKKFDTLWNAIATGTVTTRALLTANSYADWLGLWFARNRRPDGETELLKLSVCEDTPLEEKNPVTAKSEPVREFQPNPAVLEQLRSVIEWEYPFAAATNRAAKTSVTALRRMAEESDEEAEQKFSGSSFQPPAGRRAKARAQARPEGKKLSAAEIGTAHHKFLQHCDFARAGDVSVLRAESARLADEGFLSADEVAALDLTALAGFWAGPIGRKICGHAAVTKRELPFTARFAPAELDEITGVATGKNSGDDFVVVQGVADLVVFLPEEIWLLDFKTDAVSAPEMEAKTAEYAPQLKLYAMALSRIYRKPVTERWLHFLAAGMTVSLPMQAQPSAGVRPFTGIM